MITTNHDLRRNKMPPLTKEELLAQSEMIWRYADESFEEEAQKSLDKLWQTYFERYPDKRPKKESEVRSQETGDRS